MSYKGRFRPTQPLKYRGDASKITYRSLLELRFMRWCDVNEAIVMWQSEEIVIPYFSPVDHKYHRYFVDFTVMIKHKDNSVKIYLIEIKPDCQTRPPKTPKSEITSKRKRRLLAEHKTWAVNQAKWEAAIAFCKLNDWEFKIITEKQLGDYR